MPDKSFRTVRRSVFTLSEGPDVDGVILVKPDLRTLVGGMEGEAAVWVKGELDIRPYGFEVDPDYFGAGAAGLECRRAVAARQVLSDLGHCILAPVGAGHGPALTLQVDTDRIAEVTYRVRYRDGQESGDVLRFTPFTPSEEDAA